MKFIISFFLLGIISLQTGCSSSENIIKEEKNNNGEYVFDKVPIDDSSQINIYENESNYNYFIQIGAFKSKNAAENFSMDSSQLLNEELVIEYNNETSLYIVKLARIFKTRIQAEKTRNELWQIDKFKDAWILKKLK